MHGSRMGPEEVAVAAEVLNLKQHHHGHHTVWLQTLLQGRLLLALCCLLPQTACSGVSQIICMPSLQERLWKRAVAHALAHEAASADRKVLLQRTTQGRELLEQSLARVSQLMIPLLAGVVKH